MGRYKVLKSAAHNLADSFVSDVVWHETDYPMGHLLRRCRELGVETLSLDLISGDITPDGFADSVEGPYLGKMAEWFLESWIPSQHSESRYVSAARMDIWFDLDTAIPRHELWRSWRPDDLEPGSPFQVVVTIWDDRGKAWSGEVDGTQYPVKRGATERRARTSAST